MAIGNQQPIFDPSFFQQAAGTFQQAAQNAMPSQASQDNAAARVRARLEARNQDSQRQIRDQFGGFRANTGGFQQAMNMNRAAGQSALAQGLSDVEADFAQRRQEGANILAGIGKGFGELGAGMNQGMSTAQQIANAFNLGIGEQGLTQQQISNELSLGQGALQNQLQQIANDLLLGQGQLTNTQQANMINLIYALGQVGNVTDTAGANMAEVIANLFGQIGIGGGQ